MVNSGQISKHTITTPPPTSAVIELHYVALWGSHYSLWLICNDWLSSTSRAQMDSPIDYTQTKKKKNPVVQQNTDYEKLSSQPPSLLSNITHSIIPLMYFSTPPLPQKNMLLIRPVCAHMCVFLCGRTALSLCFYIRALLILASVWGPISQLCWRSINPDRSIVPPLFTGSDQRLALRYHFQLEKHS